jgi:hypothetical protein
MPPSNLPWPRSLGQRGHPAAAGEAAGVAHRVLASTPAQYDSGEPGTMIGPNSSGRIAATSSTRPAGLAVADDARLAFGARVQAR